MANLNYDILKPETLLQASLTCPHWKKTVSFLRCTVCKRYDLCEYLTGEDRDALFRSPFVQKSITGFEKRRITMHIAATKKGELQALGADLITDPKNLTPEQEQKLLQMMADGKLDHLLVVKDILKPTIKLEPLPKDQRDKMMMELFGTTPDKQDKQV